MAKNRVILPTTFKGRAYFCRIEQEYPPDPMSTFKFQSTPSICLSFVPKRYSFPFLYAASTYSPQEKDDLIYWAGPSDFTSAHVITSRKSKDIKLTFPAAGYRSVQNRKQIERQGAAIYWLNTAKGGTTYGWQDYGFGNTGWDVPAYFKIGGLSGALYPG